MEFRESRPSAKAAIALAALRAVALPIYLMPSSWREALSRPIGAVIALVYAGSLQSISREVSVAQRERPDLFDANVPVKKQLLRTMARYGLDACVGLWSSPAELAKAYGEIDTSPITRALRMSPVDPVTQQKQGIVLSFLHTGSFGHVAPLLRGCGFDKVAVVALYVKGSLIGSVYERVAQRHGFDLVRVDPGPGSRRQVIDRCAELVRQGKIVAVAGDVYLGRRGAPSAIPVHMAGKDRLVGRAIPMVSLMTGAPIVTMGTFQEGARRAAVISQQIIDPAESRMSRQPQRHIAQRVAEQSEALVAHSAGQWIKWGAIRPSVTELFARFAKNSAIAHKMNAPTSAEIAQVVSSYSEKPIVTVTLHEPVASPALPLRVAVPSVRAVASRSADGLNTLGR